jgi:uncharacterized protein YbjT (DUF2867 family)
MFVVAGATGQTGGAVAQALLRAGRSVRVLVRDPAKRTAWIDRGAEADPADLGDETALTDALRGAEGAYLLIPPSYASDEVVADRRRIAGTIAAAVARSGIRHVALLSSTGAQFPSGTGMILAPREGELAVVPAAKNVTVVRAAFFLENWAPVLPAARETGVFPTFLTASRKIPMVASADVGTTAAEALLAPARGRRVVELAGPEELSPDDVARVAGALLGREVRAEQAPVEAVVPAFRGFGMSADAARLFQEMYEAINAGRAGFEGAGTELRRGATPAADVFRKILGIG